MEVSLYDDAVSQLLIKCFLFIPVSALLGFGGTLIRLIPSLLKRERIGRKQLLLENFKVFRGGISK
jgi:hypothetical protein